MDADDSLSSEEHIKEVDSSEISSEKTPSTQPPKKKKRKIESTSNELGELITPELLTNSKKKLISPTYNHFVFYS